MPKLIAFNQVTLDGYFAGPGGDLSWAHKIHGRRRVERVCRRQRKLRRQALFGRVTYEFMASFWPTPMAIENLPAWPRK